MPRQTAQGRRSGATRRSIRRPNLGVYLDRQSLDIDPRALSDCRNVRIKNGKISNDGMGWENFPQFASNGNRVNLDNRRVLMIDEYRSRAGSTRMILTNFRDVFRYDAGGEKVEYMTPIYSTGVCGNLAGPNSTIIGVGTEWDTDIVTYPETGGYGKNAKSGYQISFGASDETDPEATWYGINFVTNNTQIDLVSDPGTVDPDTSYTIRQRMQGDNNDIWESETFRDAQGGPYAAGLDVYFLTNGIEMLSWDGSSDQMDWFYPGFVAKNLRTHKQTLAMWNFTESGVSKPGALRYTELNYPFNWTTNGAGEVLPADGVLDLLNVVPLGDQIVCYYQGDIVLMQYVGPPLYFIARVAVPGKGLVAQRAVMDFGDYHEFLSRDSIYRFDGVQLIESAKQVFREVLRRSSPNLVGQAYAYMDEENGEVIWSVPLGSDGQDTDQAPRTAYVEHYLEDVGPSLPTPCTIRDFPFTAVGTYIASSSLTFDDFDDPHSFENSALTFDDRALQAAFPFLVAGDDDGNVGILNTVNEHFGFAIKSYACFPRTALGDGEFKGLVHRIEPHTTRREGASGLLTVKLRIFDFADGDAIATELRVFDLTHQGLRYVPFRRSGRYGDVTFSTDGYVAGVNMPEPWDCAGYEIKVSAMGDR